MTKKISLTALFTAFAVVLSYIESFIPITGIPGVKIGLANFAIMLALYLLGGHSYKHIKDNYYWSNVWKSLWNSI